MFTSRTAQTADLGPAALQAAHDLLVGVFGHELTAEDWDHCLGGMHVLAFDGDELVGHAAVAQRQLLNAGKTYRTGYVEGVAVRADRRRQGVATSLMREIERIIRGSYALGALASSDAGIAFYSALGWTRWGGERAALTQRGLEPTGDDAIFVLPVDAELDSTKPLVCDWRVGDPW